MRTNLTMTILVLGIMVDALVNSPAFAASKKSNPLYSRGAPVQTFQGGLYHNDVLPGGTITGPIGPEVNGG
jgi:hypothetical protein